MASARDELIAVVKAGFWRLDAEQAPVLSALAVRTYGDPPTTSGLRRRLRRGLLSLSPAYQDAAFTLLGVTDETATLPLGERQREAGLTAGLPRLQAPSTVRASGGLQDFIVRRLVAYFEDGPEPEAVDTGRGRGYSCVAYGLELVEEDDGARWDLTTRFAAEAYRPDVDLVTLGLHGRRAELEQVSVDSVGHVKVGVRPATSAVDGPVQIVIGTESPLPLGVRVEFVVRERLRVDRADPDASLGINVAAYPTTIVLSARVPLHRASHYTRLHEVRQINNRREISSELVERRDDGPMLWQVGAGEPFTRYALRWRRLGDITV